MSPTTTLLTVVGVTLPNYMQCCTLFDFVNAEVRENLLSVRIYQVYFKSLKQNHSGSATGTDNGTMPCAIKVGLSFSFVWFRAYVDIEGNEETEAADSLGVGKITVRPEDAQIATTAPLLVCDSRRGVHSKLSAVNLSVCKWQGAGDRSRRCVASPHCELGT